jgi:hypothetical protein
LQGRGGIERKLNRGETLDERGSEIVGIEPGDVQTVGLLKPRLSRGERGEENLGVGSPADECSRFGDPLDLREYPGEGGIMEIGEAVFEPRPFELLVVDGERLLPTDGEVSEDPCQIAGIEVHGEGLHARWLLVVEVCVDRQNGEGLRRDIDRERLVEGDLVGGDPRLGKAVRITDPVAERPGLPPCDLRAERLTFLRDGERGKGEEKNDEEEGKPTQYEPVA